ncbi:hypothetical protein [Cupriavidus sp. UME77]|uniref:hypothetical protein n=1 Tax=Cupriavidus sp. UME77 TaxID=1862321 RepID=UPI0016023700|nr:hypothetical protein [Cupriavidus sp. UME77]MBB1636080.1 hypothetical protein [Cupriavidus sp. UME77]
MATLLFGLFVVAAAGFAGYWLSSRVPLLLLQSALKYATGLVGLVWFFSLYVYNKLTDLTETTGLDHRQHLDIELEVRVRLHWFWWRAAVLLACGVVMNMPAIATEAKVSVGTWFYVGGFSALALAGFMLRRVWAELEDIRQFRSYVKRLDRENTERAAQATALSAAKPTTWEADPALDGFRSEPPKKRSSKPRVKAARSTTTTAVGRKTATKKAAIGKPKGE